MRPVFDENSQAQVTAAELVRGFARWREAAQTAPVFISTHNRVTHVLTSLEHFRRMDRATLGCGPCTQGTLDGLAEFVHEGVIVADEDERIIYANTFARTFLKLPRDVVGMTFREAFPDAVESMFHAQLRRSTVSCEPHNADLPSMKRPGRWVNYQTIPLNGNVVVLFRDITDDVQKYRLADSRQATVQGCVAHPAVATVHLSPGGEIKFVDATFCDWIGLEEDRLCGVPLVELVERTERMVLREAIDAILREGEARLFRANFVANRSNERCEVKCAGTPLRGVYGPEGAVIVCTRSLPESR